MAQNDGHGIVVAYHDRRIQLGKRLTQMNGYQCATVPSLVATR